MLPKPTFKWRNYVNLHEGDKEKQKRQEEKQQWIQDEED